tara:strand:+ start:134 stop:439 length:306 start_codon:yes stop_codon:yes gene_type:complete
MMLSGPLTAFASLSERPEALLAVHGREQRDIEEVHRRVAVEIGTKITRPVPAHKGRVVKEVDRPIAVEIRSQRQLLHTVRVVLNTLASKSVAKEAIKTNQR